MKKVILLLLLSFFLLLGIHGAKRKSIAISDFKDTGADIKGLNNMVRGSLESLIHGLKRLTLVERTQMDGILKEHQLNASGIIDDNSALEFGNILGVNFLLFGDIVQGTITLPVRKTKQNKKSVKQANGTYKQVRTTFEAWDEIQCVTKVTLKIVDVSTASIKYTKTIGNKKIKKLNHKKFASKGAYERARYKEMKRDTTYAILARLAKSKQKIRPDDLGPQNKALLGETLNQNVYKFRRDLYMEFPLECVVIKIVDKKHVLLDIGKLDGATLKTRLEVFRISSIKHPTKPGKMIESRENLGELKIVEIKGDELSLAKGNKKEIAKFKVGDIVISRKQVIIRTRQ